MHGPARCAGEEEEQSFHFLEFFFNICNFEFLGARERRKLFTFTFVFFRFFIFNFFNQYYKFCGGRD